MLILTQEKRDHYNKQTENIFGYSVPGSKDKFDNLKKKNRNLLLH